VGALDDQEPETPEEDDTVLDAEIVEEGEEEKPEK
jgi:HemY protein